MVAIGGDKEITLYKAGMPLAGVISMFPAFRMNDKEETKEDKELGKLNPFVALKGRIPVKIVGSAKKGQYIITHDNGKAKAVDANHHVNTLNFIGIALEDGDGEVEVKV